MEKSVRDIYDGLAESYDKNRGFFDMSEVFNSFYGRLNRETGDLLDLGCGAGEPFDRMFADHGWRITGVDVSERMLALASRYVPEMNAVCADMRRIEFDAGIFDAVIAVYSLFHIPGSEHAAMFSKIHHWLRPNGRALFTYATKEYTGNDEFDGYKEFMGQKLFYSHKRPDELYSILKKIGFTVESADYLNIGGEVFLWVTVIR
jgi:cyclopropane fatty-acyl-phospholipid synthase-like methyltransferase